VKTLASLVAARERQRLLKEVLRLTPSLLDARADLHALREAVQQREVLLRRISAAPAAGDDAECAALNAECEQLIGAILQRDRQILAVLEEARAKMRRLLHQVGPGEHPSARMVCRTA
jgi:hypothetical protein